MGSFFAQNAIKSVEIVMGVLVFDIGGRLVFLQKKEGYSICCLNEIGVSRISVVWVFNYIFKSKIARCSRMYVGRNIIVVSHLTN